ncbi:potassium transporter 10 [Selaginella moellendorffii]|uniref:potassium transporter 10 n=1 Tax=Selaginella moellendorffii TaxID=88036 RepID=UPI000D1D0C19|nr:potassium transporter 10 [Selaginella moellendorffii]|eukprot:XP_024534361.1 potassium transporter 10 [Selaginella moellendorffii]
MDAVVETDEEEEAQEQGKGRMWKLDQTLDQPLGEEAGRVASMWRSDKGLSTATTLWLAFLSLGVVYGDLGTSPLYVFSSIFQDTSTVENTDDILGTLSLIIYTITLIPLIKYVFIALQSSDYGEGGTFALYSLICRHVKANTIQNQHHTDLKLTTYSRRPVAPNSLAFKVRTLLENNSHLQKILLVLVLLGTSMVIGDGILSPAISVLSSVKGIQAAHHSLPEEAVLVLSLLILVILFCMQRFGTGKVAFIFAPIIFLWFLSIGLIGLYNIFRHDPSIFRALSPLTFIRYFHRSEVNGWVALGGIMLSITGAEALFADLGHFSALSIQLAFTFLVFPCLLAAYMGQAAFLMHHPDRVADAFYSSVPGPLYWPMFVIATAAAIIASQATISATFSIVKQAVALGCFPRVKIVHTSQRFMGQIYVPEVNWILMALCLLITAGFRKTTQIGNAYGVAVIGVMLVTTLLMALLMVVIWQTNIFLVLLFLAVFGTVELVYISAVLFKVPNGGWVPLAIGAVLLLVMYTWHYGSTQRYETEKRNKVSVGWILGLGPSLGLVRLPGIGLFYTELAHGVPSIFSHFLTHFPAIHSILVFVCVKYLPVSTVPKEERFLVRRIGPKNYRMFRCAVRYGYKDLHKRDDHFDDLLIQTLAAFVKYESLLESVDGQDDGNSELSQVVYAASSSQSQQEQQEHDHQETRNTVAGFMSNSLTSVNSSTQLTSYSSDGDDRDDRRQDELKFLHSAKEQGIVHILGNTLIRCNEGSGLLRRATINYCYGFLRRICRDNSVIYHIPHESLLHVGMVYNV